MSLVEMLVALLVLGVILAAFASSLISFSKMSLVNERRVQASAFLGSMHEELQSIRWRDAGVYDNELAELAVLGADLSAEPPTLNGEPLVLIAAPDDARSERVPLASGTRQVDGRTYEFFQAVTWDTSAPIEETVKRFTTLVRWTVGETSYEQRFESTRAATPSEVERRVTPEIRRLEVSPSEIRLDADDRNDVPISIDVEFSRGITSAHVEMTAVDGDGTEEHTLELEPLDHVDARPKSFIGTLDAAQGAFSEGAWNFTVIGLDGLEPITGTRTVTFLPHDGEEEVSEPPTITQVIVSSYEAKIGAKHEDEGRFCEPLTVTVHVDGLAVGDEEQDAGDVRLSYLEGDEGTANNVQMRIDGDVITGSDDVVTYTFEGPDSPWEPAKDESITDRFRITARNPDGGTSPIEYSDEVTFSTNNNEMC